MITKQFILTIRVDENNIKSKYTNYSINWSTPIQFINYLAKSLQEKHLKAFGYEIIIKPKKNNS